MSSIGCYLFPIRGQSNTSSTRYPYSGGNSPKEGTMQKVLLKLLVVLAMLGLFAGAVSAETFQAPAGSSINWQDNGKGDAVVTAKGLGIDLAEHYLGEGQGWGRVVKIKVPAGDVQQFTLPDIRKNGLRFNVVKNGRWLFLACGAQEGHYPVAVPRLESGLMNACNYIGGVTEDGRPIFWGAIEHPQFMRRPGDGK